MDPFLRVFLKSDVGEVELSTYEGDAPYRLRDGARGMGLPSRSVESTPLPAGNGSAFRSQRFDESEVMLPISIRGANATEVAQRSRNLERILKVVSDNPIELIVRTDNGSTTRRRKVFYEQGLEGAVGGQDSHFTWRHAQVIFRALDPMWYGDERVVTQRVNPERKPFLTGLPTIRRRTNLVKDGGVEGPDRWGWMAFGDRDTSVSKSGQASMKLDADGEGFLYQMIEPEREAIYSAGVQVKATPEITHVQFAFVMPDSPEVAKVVPVSEDWTRITGNTGRLVEAGAYLALALRPGIMDGGEFQLTDQGSLWADECIMEDRTEVGEFFDGNTPATETATYEWLGEEHNSPSREAKLSKPRTVPFFPIVLSSSTISGVYQIEIRGDSNTWPVWEISGPGKDLLIQNITTGDRIFIEGEFTETVVVDTRPTVSDIYSSSWADGELWSRVDDDYVLFPLEPGLNQIRITMVNALPGSLIRLKYSETWLAGW